MKLRQRLGFALSESAVRKKIPGLSSNLILLLLISFVAACASVQDGNYAVPAQAGKDQFVSSGGILITGEENRDLASRYIGVVDFTFENKTPNWIHIKKVSLDFGSPEANAAVLIPVGHELAAWAKAAQQRKAISDYNTGLVLASVAVVGSAVALGSHSPGAQGIGAAMALGSLGGLTVEAFRDERQHTEYARLVPETHLMSDDFIIPPGLHTKKWIALYTKPTAPIISVATISYTFEDGKTESATLRFRGTDLLSEWQHHVYQPAKE